MSRRGEPAAAQVAQARGSAAVLDDPDVRELYVRILRGTPRTIEQIREISPSGLDLPAALEALEAAELIAVGRDGLEVHNPRIVVPRMLEAVLAQRSAHWEAAAVDAEALGPLARAWSAATSPDADAPGTGVPGAVVAGDAEDWWQTVRAGSAGAALAVLHLDLPRAWLTAGSLNAQLDERTGSLRLLVPSAEVADDAGARIAEALVARGTQLRLLRQVPGWLYVGEVAAVTLHWQQHEISGVTTSADPSIRAALAWMFEDWWHRGVDYADRDVFSLLATGHDDAEIAALLGTSVRTVHRRVAEAMDAVGARSRFELGIAWARSPQIVGVRSDRPVRD